MGGPRRTDLALPQFLGAEETKIPRLLRKSPEGQLPRNRGKSRSRLSLTKAETQLSPSWAEDVITSNQSAYQKRGPLLEDHTI